MNLPSSNISQKTVQFMFSGRETLTLPHYQRDYSWTQKEVNELFSDILLGFEEAKNDDTVEDGYLLGNIIFLTFNRKELMVLDGQQRITTLFIIFEELYKHINQDLIGILNNIKSFLYEVNNYGETDSILKLRRKDIDDNLHEFSMDEDMRSYISEKVRDEFVYDGFDDDNEIIDFLLNLNFMTQTYFATSGSGKEFENGVLADILKYFVKFNTRGRAFSSDEIETAISLLEQKKS